MPAINSPALVVIFNLTYEFEACPYMLFDNKNVFLERFFEELLVVNLFLSYWLQNFT